MREVLIQKITSLQKCVGRAREIHLKAGETFRINLDLQDAAVLNVIRACDTAIDVANMVIRQHRLGIPNQSRESFTILAREKLIDAALASRLSRMVGFRNIAVHQYQQLNIDVVEAVVVTDLDDFLEFAATVKAMEPPSRTNRSD